MKKYTPLTEQQKAILLIKARRGRMFAAEMLFIDAIRTVASQKPKHHYPCIYPPTKQGYHYPKHLFLPSFYAR